MPGEWLDRPAPVRPGEELEIKRLDRYLKSQLPDLAGQLAVEQFPSGFSNLTYLLRYPERQLVLRRPPFGVKIKSAHDMGREYKILSGLINVYPKVPRPLLYCRDESVIGAPFYVMTRLTGVILRPQMPDDMTPSPGLMGDIASAFVDNLLMLHAVDIEAAGLADLGRPEGYITRQIDGWHKRYRAAQTDDVPDLERAAAWLAEKQPAESAVGLIHNDYKYDNLVLDPDDWSSIIGVLDWEMATVGDPLMDLGTSLGYWVEAGDPVEIQALRLSPTNLPGNPTREELVELYAHRSGRELSDPVFYYVYGLFKLAVIVQQIYTRYKRGDTRDPRFANLIDAVRACGRAAVGAIEKERISS